MAPNVPESDWKVLRSLKDVLVERFCDRVLRQITEIRDETTSSHARYLKIYRLMREQDKELGLAFNDPRRSCALRMILTWKSLDLLTPEEFQRFTEETRRRIESVL